MENFEGWVINMKNGQKYKIKCEKYLLAHKNKAKINKAGIWDILYNKKDLK